MKNKFEAETGIKTNMTRRSSGESTRRSAPNRPTQRLTSGGLAPVIRICRPQPKG